MKLKINKKIYKNVKQITYEHCSPSLKNVFGYKILFVGENTFTCSYEGDRNCLLSDDDSGSETWQIVNGNGFVSDNTMNNGQ